MVLGYLYQIDAANDASLDYFADWHATIYRLDGHVLF